MTPIQQTILELQARQAAAARVLAEFWNPVTSARYTIHEIANAHGVQAEIMTAAALQNGGE